VLIRTWEPVMSLTSSAINQQSQYQQTFSQSREVTFLAKQENPEINHEVKSINAMLQENFISASIFINGYTQNNTTSKSASNKAHDDETYHRPLPPKIELMKVILENYFGSDFGELFSNFDFDRSNQEDSGTNNIPQQSTPQSNLIDIDGQLFNPTDTVKVEQWQSHKQSLHYQMNGAFEFDGQSVNVNYSFSLSSEQSSYTSIETTAAALKDPIIVQFGNQGIREIEGKAEFDINQDGELDKLPIFSGDVGYLVYDKNQNLKADNGSELFGPQTGNGFTELAQLDSNKNGFIDSGDEHYDQLYIWQPQQPNSMTSLTDAKIKAISTSGIDTPFSFYDTKGELSAQMRQSSFAISENGEGRGVHQVDVRI
jgi:hypothetical protein